MHAAEGGMFVVVWGGFPFKASILCDASALEDLNM
jgi:hypothetical protein